MFVCEDQFIGSPVLENVVGIPAALSALIFPPGQYTMASDPVWGPAELLFARAGGAIPLASLCTLTPVWDAVNLTMQQNMVVCPNTANLGRPVYVYIGNTALSAGQYGFFMMEGCFPVASNATVAADTAIGIAAAGQLGANSAGKQMLNARCVTPATQTVVSAAVSGLPGDTKIFLKSTAGFFPGVYVSGTGVGAAAICSSVDPFGKFITVTVVNSAAVTGNITATYNNGVIFYNVVAMNRPQAQGPIT
jgi:hypothetical protein